MTEKLGGNRHQDNFKVIKIQSDFSDIYSVRKFIDEVKKKFPGENAPGKDHYG